jgi:hypothetical protein
MEGSIVTLLDVISRNISGGIEENNEKPVRTVGASTGI